MKSFLAKFLIGLAIFGYVEAWGADWKLFSAHDLGSVYYDSQSLTQSSKNIIRVWQKDHFTEKGVAHCVKYLGKKYENVSHIINLVEINCLEKKRRTLTLAYYDKEGEVIYSSNTQSDWEFIIPESVAEGLYNAVCK